MTRNGTRSVPSETLLVTPSPERYFQASFLKCYLLRFIRNGTLLTSHTPSCLGASAFDLAFWRFVSRQVDRFADGEVNVMVKENVRGKDVYIIQPTCMPVNENLVELLLMVSYR